jgi:hypothetical protein
MAKPSENLDLAAEVEAYTGDDKTQGDPSQTNYENEDGESEQGDETSDEVEDETSTNEETEEPEEKETEEEKPKKTAKGRIDELTRARREAERERDFWRDKAKQAEASYHSVGTTGDEPDASKYDYGEADPLYIREVAKFEAKKALDEERQTRAQSEHNQALQGATKALIDNGRLNFADFDQKVLEGATKGTWDCSDELAMCLIDSEQGDIIAYHLASNPAEARRLSALPSRSLAREIGKLEVTLGEPPVVKPKVVSSAAPPPKRSAKGNVRTGSFDPETASMEDFQKWADKQISRRR